MLSELSQAKAKAKTVTVVMVVYARCLPFSLDGRSEINYAK